MIKAEQNSDVISFFFFFLNMIFLLCIWYNKNNFIRISTVVRKWWKINKMAIPFPGSDAWPDNEMSKFPCAKKCKNRFWTECVHKLSRSVSPLLLEQRCLIKLSFLLHASRNYFRRRRIARHRIQTRNDFDLCLSIIQWEMSRIVTNSSHVYIVSMYIVNIYIFL